MPCVNIGNEYLKFFYQDKMMFGGEFLQYLHELNSAHSEYKTDQLTNFKENVVKFKI